MLPVVIIQNQLIRFDQFLTVSPVQVVVPQRKGPSVVCFQVGPSTRLSLRATIYFTSRNFLQYDTRSSPMYQFVFLMRSLLTLMESIIRRSSRIARCFSQDPTGSSVLALISFRVIIV